jgi:hypothetical protein
MMIRVSSIWTATALSPLPIARGRWRLARRSTAARPAAARPSLPVSRNRADVFDHRGLGATRQRSQASGGDSPSGPPRGKCRGCRLGSTEVKPNQDEWLTRRAASVARLGGPGPTRASRRKSIASAAGRGYTEIDSGRWQRAGEGLAAGRPSRSRPSRLVGTTASPAGPGAAAQGAVRAAPRLGARREPTDGLAR